MCHPIKYAWHSTEMPIETGLTMVKCTARHNPDTIRSTLLSTTVLTNRVVLDYPGTPNWDSMAEFRVINYTAT
jgi:hypothetical protein